MVLAKRSPGADSPRLSSVHNLDVDASGRLYITDRGAHRVYRFDPSNAPQSVAELLVVAGNGTDAEGPSGVPATEAGLESVRGVAVNPGGGFFAATPKGGDIWFVDPRGIIHRFISGAGSGNVKAGDGEPLVPMHDKIAEPRAIALAPNGDLLITCNDNGFVRRVLRRADPPRFPFDQEER